MHVCMYIYVSAPTVYEQPKHHNNEFDDEESVRSVFLSNDTTMYDGRKFRITLINFLSSIRSSSGNFFFC